MKTLLRYENYKVKVTNHYKICACLTVVYSLFKVIIAIFRSLYYGKADKLELLINSYKEVGYGQELIDEIVQKIQHPDASEVLCECIAGLIICGLFSACYFAQDYKHRMYLQMVGKGHSRSKIFFTKLFIAWLWCASFTLINVLVYYGFISISIGLSGKDYLTSGFLFQLIISIIISALLFSSFAIMVCALFKDQTIAVVVVLLINLVGSTVISGINYFINESINLDEFWFVSIPYYMAGVGVGLPQLMKYYLVIAIYSILFVVVGWKAFKGQDF